MKKVLKLCAALVAVVLLLGAGVYLWASLQTARTYGRAVEVHEAGFPIPFPPSDPGMAEPGIGPEPPEETADAQAIERGRHLVESRYPCADCHGEDFGGGVMIDEPIIGRAFGGNLTAGEGSVTVGYTAADWDRIVRHGVGRDGTPTAMPSESFQYMSDQELSDIVAYLGSVPAVDNEVPPVSMGPVGKLLIATGKLTPAYDRITAHDEPHAEFPPNAEPSVDFGRHLAVTCAGCHREDLRGGPVPGGDPSWGPAANLTPHPDGLGAWTAEQFSAAMRVGIRPDGTPVVTPMSELVTYTARMSDVEIEALWTYLRSLPAMETGR